MVQHTPINVTIFQPGQHGGEDGKDARTQGCSIECVEARDSGDQEGKNEPTWVKPAPCQYGRGLLEFRRHSLKGLLLNPSRFPAEILDLPLPFRTFQQ